MNLYDVEECRCIIIPRNNNEANAAVQRYIIDKDIHVLGLDCEWKTRHARCPVALIQIATEKHVLLFQVCRFENKSILPRQLAKILRDRSIVKVGVNIQEDIRRIRLKFGESVLGWVDLRCFAIENMLLGENLLLQLEAYESKQIKKLSSAVDVKAKRVNFMPKLGLETLVRNCLGKALPKSFASQVLGEWEASELTQELKLYAAADAASSLDIFYALDIQIGPTSKTSNDFHSWLSVLEKPYNHKQIRLSCLDLIFEIAPSWIQPILPDYYGRSYSKRSNIALECTLEEKLVEVLSTVSEKDVTSGEDDTFVEEGMFLSIRQLFELVIGTCHMMVLAYIFILIVVGTITLKLMF